MFLGKRIAHFAWMSLAVLALAACGGQKEPAQRLIAEIKAHGDGTADSLIERIFRSVMTFAGTAAQSDDITLAILVRTAANPRDAAAQLVA